MHHFDSFHHTVDYMNIALNRANIVCMHSHRCLSYPIWKLRHPSVTNNTCPTKEWEGEYLPNIGQCANSCCKGPRSIPCHIKLLLPALTWEKQLSLEGHLRDHIADHVWSYCCFLRCFLMCVWCEFCVSSWINPQFLEHWNKSTWALKQGFSIRCVLHLTHTQAQYEGSHHERRQGISNISFYPTQICDVELIFTR